MKFLSAIVFLQLVLTSPLQAGEWEYLRKSNGEINTWDVRIGGGEVKAPTVRIVDSAGRVSLAAYIAKVKNNALVGSEYLRMRQKTFKENYSPYAGRRRQENLVKRMFVEIQSSGRKIEFSDFVLLSFSINYMIAPGRFSRSVTIADAYSFQKEATDIFGRVDLKILEDGMSTIRQLAEVHHKNGDSMIRHTTRAAIRMNLAPKTFLSFDPETLLKGEHLKEWQKFRDEEQSEWNAEKKALGFYKMIVGDASLAATNREPRQ